MHSRNMPTAEAQGVQHIEIGLERLHAYNEACTLAAKACQDEADNANGVMLRTCACRHGYQGRPTVISSSVNGWHEPVIAQCHVIVTAPRWDIGSPQEGASSLRSSSGFVNHYGTGSNAVANYEEAPTPSSLRMRPVGASR